MLFNYILTIPIQNLSKPRKPFGVAYMSPVADFGDPVVYPILLSLPTTGEPVEC